MIFGNTITLPHRDIDLTAATHEFTGALHL